MLTLVELVHKNGEQKKGARTTTLVTFRGPSGPVHSLESPAPAAPGEDRGGVSPGGRDPADSGHEDGGPSAPCVPRGGPAGQASQWLLVSQKWRRQTPRQRAPPDGNAATTSRAVSQEKEVEPRSGQASRPSYQFFPSAQGPRKLHASRAPDSFTAQMSLFLLQGSFQRKRDGKRPANYRKLKTHVSPFRCMAF